MRPSTLRAVLPSRSWLTLLAVTALLGLGIAVIVSHVAFASNPPLGYDRPLGVSANRCTPGVAAINPQAMGIPAIQPCADLMSSSGPWFTSADVVAYVATHPVPFEVHGSPSPVVVSVTFASSKQISAQLNGESTGVLDTTLLCLVHLSGTFQGDPPVGVTALSTLHDAELVFDAHTGNLIGAQV